jgi:serine/threonine protein kinase
MASSVPEFWQLVEQSRLLATGQCQQLHQEFHATNGATDHSSPQALGEWLVSRNIFSRYQVMVLLAGRPGPFVYGDYKIYDRIDSGRLANEFRAVHAGTGHPVQLKFLTGPVVQDARLWSIAATEAQIACSLGHPNLQRFFELVDLGSFKFLVEEDLHGETLAERLAVGRMPPHEACRVARMMALGLAALHPTGRAHGDVRPLNVWLEPASPQHPGNAKLLRDPLLPPGPPNFSADDPQGTLLAQSDYLAPEFQMPGKSPDVLTDLYALGCTLYQMLAGHPPFPGGSPMQKMARHAAEAIRPLESYGVPQPVAQLVTFLMAKNPSLRYQDAQTVADQLAAFVDPAIVHLPPPPSMPTLPAYEAAVQQSQARLASRSMQTAFGIPADSAPTPRFEPEAAPAIRTAAAPAAAGIPLGSVPKGKAVAATPTAPAFTVREPEEKKELIDPKIKDPVLLAAKEARERKKLITILVSVGVAAIALIIGVNMMRGGKGKPEANQDPNAPVEPENTVPELTETIGLQPDEPQKPISLPKNFTPGVDSPELKPKRTDTPAETGATFEVVADDGKLPWASPTSGPPVDLKYVPPMAGVYIAVRPADLAANSEGAKVLKALGPKFAAVQSDWEKAAGLKFTECRQMVVSLHDNKNAMPKVSVVAHLNNALTGGDLVANCGAAVQEEEGKEYYSNDAWGYYLPGEEDGKVLVMAAVDDIKEVLKEPEAFRKREVEQVRRNTDADRHVTVLFDPTFLFSGEGDPLFSGDFARVKDPLKWLLGDGLQAGALSMHFGDSFYWELRVQTKVDKLPQELATDFRKRMEEVPANLKSYFVKQLDPPPYWKGLAFDFPAMVKSLHDNCRVGMESNQAIVNAYLPGPAAHNLVLGTELAIATAPGAGTTVAVASASGPKTVEEVLELKMKNFSFDQTTFETAIQDVEKESRELLKGAPVDYGFVIIGDDLKEEGLTRNKSLQNFKMENKSVGDVLTGLCMANNNVPGVKEASELNQKLIWCIADDTAGKKKVFITTRAGATKRGYKLPAVFEPKK